MIKNYFSLDEDFEGIIRNVLDDKKINWIKQISTGWTNIVFEVSTNDGNFFLRFPRDEFWIRTIVKDYEFSNFIYGKTDFNTVKLTLLYDNDRPFTMHKKIEGPVLADKIDSLNSQEIRVISMDIAKFMFQLHNIKFDKDKIFTIDNIGVDLIDFLDELLNVHVNSEDMSFWNYDEFIKKDNYCLVHGDLNLSNILLDNKNHISAIIDFGFGGFGNKYFDIARVLSRNCPSNFKSEIINSYEILSKENLEINVLNTEIDIWKNIDNAYINYMKSIGIYE